MLTSCTPQSIGFSQRAAALSAGAALRGRSPSFPGPDSLLPALHTLSGACTFRASRAAPPSGSRGNLQSSKRLQSPPRPRLRRTQPGSGGTDHRAALSTRGSGVPGAAGGSATPSPRVALPLAEPWPRPPLGGTSGWKPDGRLRDWPGGAEPSYCHAQELKQLTFPNLHAEGKETKLECVEAPRTPEKGERLAFQHFRIGREEPR